jgi:TfoX/Sxy family transcriptional regulator of competence genes
MLEKRVNVLSIRIVDENKTLLQEGGIYLRTTKSLADELVSNGTHVFTSKSKLKSILKNKK